MPRPAETPAPPSKRARGDGPLPAPAAAAAASDTPTAASDTTTAKGSHAGGKALQALQGYASSSEDEADEITARAAPPPLPAAVLALPNNAPRTSPVAPARWSRPLAPPHLAARLLSGLVRGHGQSTARRGPAACGRCRS